MVASALVRSEIDAGLNLVRALDAAGFGAVAALWLYDGDNEKWKMVIAYREGGDSLEQKYQQAAAIAADWRSHHPADPILDLSKVRITSMQDRLIQALQPRIHVDGLREVRLSHDMINGVYVEEALVHRLAA